MGNIVDYLYTYGFFDFQALPFGAVDALVLAQFSYLKFNGLVDGVVPDAKPITVEELHRHPHREGLFADPRWEEQNRALFENMALSKRYRDMKCIYAVDSVCTEAEVQFAAMTCILSDGSVKIVYRGTDESLVGWKEDFNMAFQYPIPGQAYGQEYLKQVAVLTEGELELIGHSKGGNLAVYAAMHAPEEVGSRILRIYNLDGPGFRTEVYKTGYFERIVDRIVKIIPRSSVVGMILENHGDYKVVDSKSIGLLQHDPFSWKVDRIDFAYVDQMDEGHRIMDESLNAWIMSLSQEEVSTVVNTLYQIVLASEAKDLNELTKNWTKSLAGIAGAIQSLDPETREMLQRVAKSLVKASGTRLREETELFFHNKIEGLTNQLIGKEGQ